jgi:hypothetical protein
MLIITDANNNDISNDTTASHGGIAVASTEGSPLVSFVGGGGTVPATYKKIFWFESGAFTGLATDAWLTNYAFGVGTTSMSSGTKFAVGNIELDFDDITAVRNINSTGVGTFTTLDIGTGGIDVDGHTELDDLNVSGVSTFTDSITATSDINANGNIVGDNSTNISGINQVTATTFVGALTGTATTATKLETARDFSVSGDVATASAVSFNGTGNVDLAVTLSNSFDANTSGIITASSFVGDLTGTATTATNLANAANITTGTISDDRLPATITSDITGNAATATTATNLANAANITTGTIDDARLPATITSDITGTATTATNLADAANITTGTISDDRLPASITSDITGNALMRLILLQEPLVTIDCLHPLLVI